MSVALPKLTWEDYRSIPPDGKRESGGFERAVALAAERGERLESPLLPGLALPLVDLFAS